MISAADAASLDDRGVGYSDSPSPEHDHGEYNEACDDSHTTSASQSPGKQDGDETQTAQRMSSQVGEGSLETQTAQRRSSQVGQRSTSKRRFSGSSVNEMDIYMSRLSLHTNTQRRLSGRFIESESTADDALAENKCRKFARLFITSSSVELFITAAVVLDFVLTCLETDQNANGVETQTWVKVVQNSCLVLYTIEFAVVLYVKRSRVFDEFARRMDFFIIAIGYVELLIEVVNSSRVQGMGGVRVFRALRAARMLRVVRRFAEVKELRRLLLMMWNCLKTLFWALLLLLMIMTMWAMLHVELVHPIVVELVDGGDLSGCPECRDAYKTIMDANLSIFATIVAGDGWSRIAVPVIKAAPSTAFIFVGSTLTLLYGILNLVIAVVVDTFAEQRDKDEKQIASDLQDSMHSDVEFFKGVFVAIDADRSGDLSLEELIKGARSQADFRNRLRIMDIDEQDLSNLFTMMDSNNSGAIDAEEFVNTLSRWRQASLTAARFAKYNMITSLERQEDMMQEIMALHAKLGALEPPTPSEGSEAEIDSDLPRVEVEALKHRPGNEPLSDMLQSINDLARKAEVECMKLLTERTGVSRKLGGIHHDHKHFSLESVAADPKNAVERKLARKASDRSVMVYV